jgi:hypothetical protein
MRRTYKWDRDRRRSHEESFKGRLDSGTLRRTSSVSSGRSQRIEADVSAFAPKNQLKESRLVHGCRAWAENESRTGADCLKSIEFWNSPSTGIAVIRAEGENADRNI